MKKLYLLFTPLLIGLALISFTPPLSVVIIGGGPAGLATAIEARQTNARVTVIEKRNTHERIQRLFLVEQSLKLLEKWNVESSELNKINVGKERIGIIRISDLEKALLKRALELGVFIVHDECVEISQNERSIFLKKENSIPYDILIAADGPHSHVRETLGIEIDLISQGKAGAALIPSSQNEPTFIDISPDIQHGDSFIKKFYFPGMQFMFLQGPVSASQDDFINLCKASGWELQAKEIEEGNARLLLDVNVSLQKAKAFSNYNQKALIVGDAAGTGTFFRGTGANYALKTAEIAGHFFHSHDFEYFETEMNTVTNALIEDSAFLFLIDLNHQLSE